MGGIASPNQTSSSSSQAATNQQSAADSGGVAFGAQPISITTGAVRGGNGGGGGKGGTGGGTGTSVSPSVDLTNQQATATGGSIALGTGSSGSVTIQNTSSDPSVVHAALDSADHMAEIVGRVSSTAINTNALVAGAALNANQNVTGMALTYGQNITAQNYDALNRNTALAFSTIDHLITGETSGQLAAGSGGGSGSGATIQPIIYPMPGTSGAAESYFTKTEVTIGVALLAAVAIALVLKK